MENAILLKGYVNVLRALAETSAIKEFALITAPTMENALTVIAYVRRDLQGQPVNTVNLFFLKWIGDFELFYNH